MNARLAYFLVCPACVCSLQLRIETKQDGEIIEGLFRCPHCNREYPVHRSIPRFLPDHISKTVVTTIERFGYEWTYFSEILPHYEAQFLGWIAPASPEDFKGRVVLDAGCGKGRHLRLAAQFGATEVIGVDLGLAVEAASFNTKNFPNVSIIQADLHHLPLAPTSFDLVYSVGMLHHLPDPFVGFQTLVRLLKLGGRIILWVYGREGNGWVVAFMNPIRRITSRLPLPLVRALSAGIALLLWLALRAVYRPIYQIQALAQLRGWLPYRAYLKDLLDFPQRFMLLPSTTCWHLLLTIFLRLQWNSGFMRPGLC